MITKTYISNSKSQFSMPVTVQREAGKVAERVSFTGKTLNCGAYFGTFTTNDEALQKALEANKWFNKEYSILAVSRANAKPAPSVEDEEESAGTLSTVPPVEASAGDEEDFELPESTALTAVAGITSWQDAKKWMVDHKGLAKSFPNNPVKLLEKATALGVVFPDIPKA